MIRVLTMADLACALLSSASPLIRAASVRLNINIMLCSFYGDKVMCADLAWPDHSVEEIDQHFL